MHHIKKELFTKYPKMTNWEEQYNQTWADLYQAVMFKDLDKAFACVKRLLFIKKRLIIK